MSSCSVVAADSIPAVEVAGTVVAGSFAVAVAVSDSSEVADSFAVVEVSDSFVVAVVVSDSSAVAEPCTVAVVAVGHTGLVGPSVALSVLSFSSPVQELQ